MFSKFSNEMFRVFFTRHANTRVNLFQTRILYAEMATWMNFLFEICFWPNSSDNAAAEYSCGIKTQMFFCWLSNEKKKRAKYNRRKEELMTFTINCTKNYFRIRVLVPKWSKWTCYRSHVKTIRVLFLLT